MTTNEPLTRVKSAFHQLGSRQQGVLLAVQQHGRRSPHAGWVWGTPNETVVILESLVRRGLVTSGGDHNTVYTLTARGLRVLNTKDDVDSRGRIE